MNCEREGCGDPLAIHDPCSRKGCKCRSFVPQARKRNVAKLTDLTDEQIAAALRDHPRG